MMNRSGFLNIDWGLLMPVLVLIILSFTTLFSLQTSLFWTQFIFFIISLIAFFVFSQIDYEVLRSYALPIYIASLIFLCFILFIGIESRGAVRWIDLFGFRVQFSEILKPFLSIAFASFLLDKKRSLLSFSLAIGMLLPVVSLIFIQPDLGNAVIYFLVVLIALLIFGFPLRWFGLGILSFVFIAPFLWNILHFYQKQRILTFLQPTKDPLGTSYNVIQAIIAVGSGQFFGKGLGESTQSVLRFLPERHTDFIFATLSEGLGFVGVLITILAFVFLLHKIYSIVSWSKDSFVRLFATLVFLIILFQFFINIGMNIGIIPVVGITLPFVSYGGSSLLSSFIMLGILSSMSRISKDYVLEIK